MPIPAHWTDPNHIVSRGIGCASLIVILPLFLFLPFSSNMGLYPFAWGVAAVSLAFINLTQSIRNLEQASSGRLFWLIGSSMVIALSNPLLWNG